MKMRMRKAFTLIELLVVIAIIGILAAMILVALSTARNKAKDSRVKSDMGQFAIDAVTYGDTNGNWDSWCAQAGVTNFANLKADVLKNDGNVAVTCNVNAAPSTIWAISAPLTGSGSNVKVCTDSTGITRQGTTAAAAAGACDMTVGTSDPV